MTSLLGSVSATHPFLLFFDTFVHESVELNVDLVQFPKPVVVHEVRVIPRGARVQSHRVSTLGVGCTCPNAFSLELFVNDLLHPGSATFAPLGTMHYDSESTIVFKVQKCIPTDGLVLRGVFSQITLAVVGSMSDVVSSEQMRNHNLMGDTNETEEEADTESEAKLMRSQSVNTRGLTSFLTSLPPPSLPLASVPPPSIPLVPPSAPPPPISSVIPSVVPPSITTVPPVMTVGPPVPPSMTSIPAPSKPHPMPSPIPPSLPPSMSTAPPPIPLAIPSMPPSASMLAPSPVSAMTSSPLPNGVFLPTTFSRPPPPLPPIRFDQPPPNMLGMIRHRPPPPRGRRPLPYRRPPASTSTGVTPTTASTTEDVLDNVSDISEGDIPEMEDVKEDESGSQGTTRHDEQLIATVETSASQAAATTEFMEEISDDEANWSDIEEDDEERLLQDVWDDDNELIHVFEPHKARLPLTTFASAKTEMEDGELEPHLQSILDACRNHDVTVVHLEQLEQLRTIVEKKQSVVLKDDLIAVFVEVIKLGLDMKLLAKSTPAKICVRHIKATLNLTRSLAKKSLLTDIGLADLEDLLQIIIDDHISSLNTALPLRLLALDTVEALLAIPKLSTLPFVSSDFFSQIYSTLLKVLTNKASRSRIRAVVEELLTKVHFVQVANDFHQLALKQSLLTETEVLSEATKMCSALTLGLEDCQSPRSLLPMFHDKEGMEAKMFEWKLCILDNVDLTSHICHMLKRLRENSSANDKPKAHLEQESFKLFTLVSSRTRGLNMLCLRPRETNDFVDLMYEDNRYQRRQLVSKLNLRIHAYHNLKSLRDVAQSCDEVVVENLQKLFGMTFASVGHKRELANLFVLEMETLMAKVLDFTNRESQLTPLIRSYVSQLVLFGLQHCESNCLSKSETTREIIQSFCDVYKDVGSREVDSLKEDRDENEEKYLSNDDRELIKIEKDVTEELGSWLKVVMSTQTSDRKALCEQLKKSIRLMANEMNSKDLEQSCSPPPEVLWSLKRLVSVTVDDLQLLLVYKTGLMDELFQWLTKLCDTLEQTMPTILDESSTLMRCIRLVVRLWRDIWRLIIDVRDKKFKDTTTVDLAIRLFCVLSEDDPLEDDNNDEDDRCLARSDIFSILTCFTLPSDQPLHLKDATVKSDVWTTMVNRLIDLTLSRPYRLKALLPLLCALVPSHLPLQVGEDGLDKESEMSLVRSRNIWSVHLFPLRESLAKLIGRLVLLTADSKTRKLGLSLCLQLADCSIPMAEMVFDALHETVDDNSSGDKLTLVSVNFSINFITRLTQHLRVCLVSRINSTKKPNLSKLISSLEDKSESVLVDEVFTLLHVLFTSEEVDEIHRSRLCPGLKLTRLVIDALLRLLWNTAEIKVVTRCLRFLCQAAQADDVFCKCLIQRRPIGPVWVDVLRKFDDDSDDDVADFVIDLAAFIDLCCIEEDKLKPDGPETLNLTTTETTDKSVFSATTSTGMTSTKTETTTTSDSTAATGTTDVSSNVPSVLDSFISRALVLVQPHKLKVTRSEVSRTLKLLKSQIESMSADDPEREDEEDLPEMEEDCKDSKDSLLALYSTRVLTQSSASFETKTVALRPLSEVQMEMDLRAVANKCLGESFDLQTELRKRHLGVSHEVAATDGRGELERKAMFNKSLISQYKSGMMYIRRGFHRRDPSTSHEAFRVRTSRPPSLHVDDFVLLQERGQQPTGPTGYNRQSVRAARELIEARQLGRGAHVRQGHNRVNVQRANRPPPP